MAERGLAADYAEPVISELEEIRVPAAPRTAAVWRDMRDRLWVSIDNDDSLDLDQLTYAEKLDGKEIIYVAIADVDAIVKKDSAIDRHAAQNTTSVYTPTQVFPMLPVKLSNDLTSLNEHADRCAVVVEMTIDDDGRYELSDVYPAYVCNQAKLAYNAVAGWLERDILLALPLPILHQLKRQDAIAQRIQKYRTGQGALGFETIEVQPVIVNNEVVRVEEKVVNRAHKLIENFMIAANVCVTRYLAEWNMPVMRRIVRTPKRWSRIVELARHLGERLPQKPNVKALRDFLALQRRIRPEHFNDLSLSIIKLLGRGEYVLGEAGGPALGHFDLALRDYAHTTAPNRRFPDLIMQRLLKSHFYGEAVPYRRSELIKIARRCTEKEDDAVKVERRLVKCAAAMMLVHRVGERYKAMVTGASLKGTWVRITQPPIEGRLTHGYQDVDVGDWIEVQLIRVDIHNGHIDFRRC
ncbi:MAG: rnr-B [Parachlamydiales bacterium]|nr:rnr-B [Parachlamydiales bacterium]